MLNTKKAKKLLTYLLQLSLNITPQPAKLGSPLATPLMLTLVQQTPGKHKKKLCMEGRNLLGLVLILNSFIIEEIDI